MPENVPSHLLPDGPHGDLLPKRVIVDRRFFDAYRDLERRRERLLTNEHIAAIDEWFSAFAMNDLAARKAASAFEARVYQRQVGAWAMAHGDADAYRRLVKVVLRLGAADADTRDRPWRMLALPLQVGSAFGQADAVLRSTLAELHPPAVGVFDSRLDFLRKQPQLELVHHRPSDRPMLEPAFDAAFAAERVKYSARAVTAGSKVPGPPWPVPADGYLDQRPAGADGDGIDLVNVFLESGNPDQGAVAAAASMSTTELGMLEWAARYWAGDRWADTYPTIMQASAASSSAASELVVVQRHGGPALAPVLKAGSARRQ